jgi:hypothetical protein
MDEFEIALMRVRERMGRPRARYAQSGRMAEQYRSHYMRTIREKAPYACMLTINFAHPYADEFLLPSMNEFVKQLNRKLFKSGGKKNAYYLEGFCSAEVCREGGALDGSLHFHFVIREYSKLNVFDAEEVLLPKVLKILKGMKDTHGRSISNKKLVKVSPCTCLDGLVKYVTKEFEEDKSGVEAEGYIGALAMDGIVGLDIPKGRKKRYLIRAAFD